MTTLTPLLPEVYNNCPDIYNVGETFDKMKNSLICILMVL